MILQHISKLKAVELDALVGVADTQLALPQSLLQAVQAEVVSMVLDNRQATTYRLCQSLMATK